MTDVRLTIVTTRPRAAMRQVFGADMAVPSWIAIVSEPSACGAIPDGMRCLGIFYEPRGAESALEKAWHRRRRGGGVCGMTGADLLKLKAWAEKRGGSTDALLPGDAAAGDIAALNRFAPDAAVTGVRHLEASHG